MTLYACSVGGGFALSRLWNWVEVDTPTVCPKAELQNTRMTSVDM
jgi:hypothetical protein